MVCREPFYEYSRYFVTPDIIVGFRTEYYGSDGTPVTTGVTTFPHCLAGCNLEIKCDLGTLRNRVFFVPMFVEFIYTTNSYSTQQFIALIHQEPKGHSSYLKVEGREIQRSQVTFLGHTHNK